MQKKEEAMFGKALSRRQFLEQSVVGGFVAGLGSVPKLSALAAFETASAADGVKLEVIGSAGEGLGGSILDPGHTLVQHTTGGRFRLFSRMANEAWKTVLATGRLRRGRAMQRTWRSGVRASSTI